MASILISKINKAQNDNAIIVAISGDLGSGKTNLTQEVAFQFGIKENIISPTFVIMKKYKIYNSAIEKSI